MVDNVTSTLRLPSGLWLLKLQTPTCDSAVANWVEEMILYGISDTTLWSQRHKTLCLPPPYNLVVHENWP